MSPEKLIRMANQIAAFFETQPDGGPEAIAAHINDFWEPRMRARLLGLSKDEARTLRPGVLAALPMLRTPHDA